MTESFQDMKVEKILFDIPSTLSSKKKMFSSVLQNHPDLSKVCYIPGFQINESISGIDILGTSKVPTRKKDDYCQIELKTERPNDSSQKLCFLQKPFKEVPKNKEVFKLDEACMHHRELYPITFPESRKTVFPLHKSNESGFNLLTIEATTKKQSSFECPTDSQTGGKVVVCYPMAVQSIVVVPSSCVNPLESIQGYKPGVVLITVLLHVLSNEVEKEQAVQIISDE
ncbi:unnamed protein product [Mytilus coruscus]|uniref:Uncharacterized protein n=1 Tax=Mytilus coruscus TaxID=42192 RepID=A0A6J8B4D1_MYTCO|nr:unnamed protein product [Mytilus coruscus]